MKGLERVMNIFLWILTIIFIWLVCGFLCFMLCVLFSSEEELKNGLDRELKEDFKYMVGLGVISLFIVILYIIYELTKDGLNKWIKYVYEMKKRKRERQEKRKEKKFYDFDK